MMNRYFGLALLLCYGWSVSHADNTKVYAVSGNDYKPCVFPFMYKSKWYSDCITDGSSEGRLWCSTTGDFDKDQKWGYCARNSIYAVGANDDGQSCIFPFKYKSKWYSDCTSVDSFEGRPWCATTADYDEDKKWGYCTRNLIYTEDGNGNALPCVFPFNYNSNWYSDCTRDGSSDGRPWCSTTADYAKDGKWGYCKRKSIYAIGGNANGQPCVFPFKYKSNWYSDCTSEDSSDGRLWCATTEDYDRDQKRGYCSKIYAVDGNTNSQPCVFPFMYNSKWHSDCTGDGTSDGRLWCSTTADYAKDSKWGYCSPNLIHAVGGNANGEPCVFPFKYNSKWYSDCTSAGSSVGRVWCSTTSDYDKDRKWGYCTCDVMYAVGGNAKGEPCVFPFMYKSKWYSDCTGDGSSEGRQWCATTEDYNKDKKWGYCTRNLIYAVGGNDNGQLCVFPFKYKSQWHSDCTGEDGSEGRLWCATTEDFDKDQKWGYCTRNLIFTLNGKANDEPCVFPFKFNSKWYSECTSDGATGGHLWCATTADYAKDGKWAYCPSSLIYAVGGNANGERCVLPFKYKSHWYSDCTSDDGSEGRLWCSTTSDYDNDHKWGYCARNLIYTVGGNSDSQLCVFPFNFNSKWYSECTRDGSSEGRLWCATTAEYAKDGKWGYCSPK